MTTETSPPLIQDGEPVFTLENVTAVSRNGKFAKYVTSITVGRIGELLESGQIWVDYDYQRGFRVSYGADGSEKRVPMVDRDRVNEIADKMLSNELYGGSLTWSLRRAEVEFRYEPLSKTLHILTGKPTIPDSNHRHQAVAKVFGLVRSRGYPFDLNGYEFPLLIEVLDLDEERALFFEYNQLGKPANPTRSKWINQADAHNSLTSQVISCSGFEGNVELVTNNISKNSTKVVTFNALATALKAAFPDLDDSNFEDIKEFVTRFFNRLQTIRPETGSLTLSARKRGRESSIGDSAVAFYAYGMLAADLRGFSDWEQLLAKLGDPYQHVADNRSVWEGDVMSRENPAWNGTVLLMGRSGHLQISNNRETRQFIHEKLREVVGLA